ncbi:MAG: alanine racemase [Acidobacteriota bacterium]
MSIRRDLRPTWAEIDLGAFTRNVEAVARSLPDGSRLIAVLKANGYGHGAVELARRCAPDRVAMIATALLEESLELRRAGIDLPLMVFGPLTREQIVIALDENVTIGVVGPEELEDVCTIARERDVAIHLKLDSGMGRMGVTGNELPRVVEMIRATPRLRVEAVYTHYASADEDDELTAEQSATFDRMRGVIDAPLHHMANSAATLRGIVRPGDYVRAGIVLLGVRPSRPPSPGVPPGDDGGRARPPTPAGGAPPHPPLRRWRTGIMRRKDLHAGPPVGYGATFRTGRKSRIATLPVGYADGYDRLLSNRGEVLVRGRRAPVVGRVSMDLVTIDVTDIADASLGDEVELLGETITAQELAEKTSTITYEVFCRISARVPRVYR